MRNVSKKFLETMQERRDFYAVAEITFASGVKKTISKSDLTVSGNSIYDGAGSSSFPLGLLIPRQINLSLDNHDDRWSEYDFYGAKISLKTVFDFDDGTSEEINIGEYTIVTPESYGTVVGITAVDDSYKADKDYSTSLSFPVSLGTALQDSCETCGINLLTTVFPNSDYVIPAAPVSITHRQFIGMCAMIAGGNAKFDEQNRLKIVPYDFSAFENISWLDGGTFAPWSAGDNVDGGTFEPWTSGQNVDGGTFGDRDGIHILYQFAPGIKIEADDVVITGVQMESEDAEGNKTTHLFGTTGYVLSVENQLAKGNEDEALKLIGAKIVGLRFRPFTGDHIALPTAESMDLAVIVDRKNNAYTTVLTDVDFTYFGFTSMKCTADSPIRNQSIYYGNETKAIVQARQMVEAEKTQRELAVEALAKQIAQNNSLYLTEERQAGGGSVFYLHNQPTVKESSIIWKLTADAIAVSTDYGKTYPVGIDATGVAILNKIYTAGLNANYITSGKVNTERLDVDDIFAQDITATGIIRGATLIGGGLETESQTIYFGHNVRGILNIAVKNGALTASMHDENSGDDYTIDIGAMSIRAVKNLKSFLEVDNELGKVDINGEVDATTIREDGTLLSEKYAPNWNYAGAETNGGSALTADRLTSNAGSKTNPVYFQNGRPYACDYELNKTVPSDAKFTDTTYTSLKNPYALTLQFNGTPQNSYDGSTPRTYNITPGAIGAATSGHSHNYLPTGGGTLSGSLTLPTGSISTSPTGLRFNGSAAAIFAVGNNIHLKASGSADRIAILGTTDNMWTFCPYTDGSGGFCLGTSNHRWNTIYSTSGSISTSDAKQKNSIMPLSAAYEAVFEQLRPVSYRFNGGHRTHTGFISQDIEKSLDDNGMTGEDWAAFCKDDDGNGDFVYGLRYEEIIALNTHMIQKLMKRVDELEAEIRELKGVI